MINFISQYPQISYYNKINHNNAPSFQGSGSVVKKYVKPIEPKHLNVLETIAEFFKGATEILQKQFKKLSTQSGSLTLENSGKPIPQASTKTYDCQELKFRPKKFYIDDKLLDTCHFELKDKNKTKMFDVILSENTQSPKKGDVFSYEYHSADKHPIKDEEVQDVNLFFEKYGNDIIKILRKYNKKLS